MGDRLSLPLERYLNKELLNLKDCLPGATVTICSINPGLCCAQRLRELGLIEGSHVLLMKQEDPVLLMVKDSRIAIDPATARQITVSQIPAGEAAENGSRSEVNPLTTLPFGGNGR